MAPSCDRMIQLSIVLTKKSRRPYMGLLFNISSWALVPTEMPLMGLSLQLDREGPLCSSKVEEPLPTKPRPPSPGVIVTSLSTSYGDRVSMRGPCIGRGHTFQGR